ncbi:MAG: sensor histidine kinase [Gemmobacter sp.]
MTRDAGDLFLPALSGDNAARQQAELLLLSHDLAAAVADVLSGLAMMRSDALPEADRMRLDQARAAGNTMSCLLDGMRDVLSNVPRPMSRPLEPLAITDLLDRIEARWAAPAAARGLALCLTYAPGTIGTVMTDPVSLERILSHLVGNAATHATRGPITLTVAPGPSDGPPVFSVTDAGPGLPPGLTDRPAIREGGAGAAGDRGLGLFIARDLARRLGAELTLATGAEGGTEARLALPPEALPVIPVVETLPDLTGLNILLVERSTSQRQAISALLSLLGARVTATADPAAAATAKGVDAMLVDAALMEADTLRCPQRPPPSQPPSSRPPSSRPGVLALTTRTDPEGHERLRALGADAVLIKPCVCPVTLGLAILTLRATTAMRPEPGHLGSEPQTRGTAGHDPLAFDPELLDRLLILVGPSARAELCGRIRSDLDALRHGIERAAAPPCDGQTLRRHAHGLIALAGTCGATGLHRIAQELHLRALEWAESPDPALLAALRRGHDMLMQRIGTPGPSSPG